MARYQDSGYPGNPPMSPTTCLPPSQPFGSLQTGRTLTDVDPTNPHRILPGCFPERSPLQHQFPGGDSNPFSGINPSLSFAVNGNPNVVLKGEDEQNIDSTSGRRLAQENPNQRQVYPYLTSPANGRSPSTIQPQLANCSGNIPTRAAPYPPQRHVNTDNISSTGIYPGALQENYASKKGHLSRNQIDSKLKEWFFAVDIDKSGQISAQELQKALVNANWSHFSEDACRMMIDMYDQNASGSIDINEFQQLFDSISNWKKIFEGFDQDQSGAIEESELHQALQQMGYGLTSSFAQDLLVKYDPRTRKLTLDNFIVVCVQIKRVSDGFRSRDRGMQGQATLRYEDFMGLAMGLHH